LRIKFYPSLQIKFHIRAEQILSSSLGKIPLSPLCILTARVRKALAAPYRMQSALRSKAQNI